MSSTRRQPRWVYGMLLDGTAATLTQFAADPKWLGGIDAFTLKYLAVVIHIRIQNCIK